MCQYSSPYHSPSQNTLWLMDGGHYGTYAYVISPSAAAAMLKAVYPAYAQVDSIIIDVAKAAHLRVFMSHTPLLSVNNFAGRDSRTQRWALPTLRMPRVLHAVSAAGFPVQSASSENVLAVWADLHPNWELKRWNESNLPSSVLVPVRLVSGSPEQLHRQACFELIWRFGGVYVDADIEPIRSIEPLLLGIDAFVAYESDSLLTEHVFGAIPHHPLFRTLVSSTRELDDSITKVSGPALITAKVEESLSIAPAKDFRAFESHIFFPPSPASDTDLLLAYAVQREHPSLAATLWGWLVSLFSPQNPSTPLESAARARRANVVSSLSSSLSASSSSSTTQSSTTSLAPSPSQSASPRPSLTGCAALQKAYEDAKGAATLAVQRSGASYCAMKIARNARDANSCGALSASNTPAPYSAVEDGLSACIQAAIAPLSSGFFKPSLLASNREVFDTGSSPTAVFPISVGCYYGNIVASAVRFTLPVDQTAGGWTINALHFLLSLSPRAVSRTDVGDYLVGIYSDDGAAQPAPATQVGAYTRISSLTSNSSVTSTPSWIYVPVEQAGWAPLAPNSSYWIALIPGSTTASFTDDGVQWNGFEPSGATPPSYLQDTASFSGAVVFQQYCSQPGSVAAVQGLSGWASDLGSRTDSRLRYGLQVWGSAANAAG